jgi:hypothetical protein
LQQFSDVLRVGPARRFSKSVSSLVRPQLSQVPILQAFTSSMAQTFRRIITSVPFVIFNLFPVEFSVHRSAYSSDFNQTNAEIQCLCGFYAIFSKLTIPIQPLLCFTSTLNTNLSIVKSCHWYEQHSSLHQGSSYSWESDYIWLSLVQATPSFPPYQTIISVFEVACQKFIHIYTHNNLLKRAVSACGLNSHFHNWRSEFSRPQ